MVEIVCFEAGQCGCATGAFVRRKSRNAESGEDARVGY